MLEKLLVLLGYVAIEKVFVQVFPFKKPLELKVPTAFISDNETLC